MIDQTQQDKNNKKAERTLVRLTYSLLADNELHLRDKARKEALARGEGYQPELPALEAAIHGDDPEG